MELKFSERKYNRIRNKYRLLLGLRQLIHYPFINIIWIIVGLGIYTLYRLKNFIMTMIEINSYAVNLINIALNTALLLIIIFCPIAILHVIGELSARNDEANINIALGENSIIKKYQPILIYKKFNKKTGVTTRVFYSAVSKQVWEDKAEAISDRLNIYILNGFSYGGRNSNNGNLVTFDSTNNRTPMQRGDLIDDEF